MISDNTGWVASQFARLSTGLKMLLILSLGLLPLGLVAILASVQSAQDNRSDRVQEIQQQVELSASHLNGAINRSALTMRAASTAIAETSQDSPVCEHTLARLAKAPIVHAAYALYDANGDLRCATPGFTPPAAVGGPVNGSTVSLTSNEGLAFLLFGQNGRIEAAGAFPREAVLQLTGASQLPGASRLELVQRGRTSLLYDSRESRPLARSIERTTPIAGNQLQLRLTAALVPISAAELVLVLLPVVMWISAAVIGWLIVDRLLLKPLVRMQKVISAYRPGDRDIVIPAVATPAREIGELGQAFDEVTRTVARHEAELEAAVDRQTRLVREVHHRVKNNLQVVASLLNLHSRGSTNEDVAAAYASIQRRVDALAVVHRNHYAELEENRGVALKPLISELGANLRATAPRNAAQMAISLNIEPYYVTQDVAVSVAFLITEIVEFAMFCNAAGVKISLSGNMPTAATLTIESDSLRAGSACDAKLFERFDRIITGLSRQLRSNLARDGESGTYSLSIAVVDKVER